MKPTKPSKERVDLWLWVDNAIIWYKKTFKENYE